MGLPTVATGIDLGNHAIKVVQLRRRGRKIELAKAARVDLGDLYREEDSARRTARLAALLKNALRQEGIRPRNVIAGVSGKQIIIRYAHVPPVPAWKLKMLMEYEIEEEAPGTLEEVCADFKHLELPVRGHEFTIMIVMAKNEVVDALFDVTSRAGVRIEDVTLSGTALFNCSHYGMRADDERTTILLDVGADNVDMIIQSNGRLYFARNFSPGAAAFTESLQDEFRLSFQEAESKKVEDGRIVADESELETAGNNGDGRRISSTLSRRANGLASMVQSSIMFCRAQTKMTDLKIDSVRLVGGGSELSGLAKYLNTRLATDVEYLDPFDKIDITRLRRKKREEVEIDRSAYGVAAGLALSQLYADSTRLSLLPKRVQAKREFRVRGIFLWFACAFFVVTLGVIGYSSHQVIKKRADFQKELEQKKTVGEKAHTDLDAALATNKEIVAGLVELEHRVSSSKEQLQALGILKRETPREVQLTGYQTFFGEVYDKTRSEAERERDPRSKADFFFLKKSILVEGLVKAEIEDQGQKVTISVDDVASVVRRFVEFVEKHRLLFDTECTDLDSGGVPGELRKKFADEGIVLSESVTVRPEPKGGSWRITDGAQAYVVKREPGKLNVYDARNALLFDVVLNELDSGKIPSDLREAFASNGASLSEEGAKAQIIEKGRSWLLADGKKAYVARKTASRLEVYTYGLFKRVDRRRIGVDEGEEGDVTDIEGKRRFMIELVLFEKPFERTKR